MAGRIADWLAEIGLARYQQVFAENEIDWDLLPQLSESDLKELGLPLGPRKKLLDALGRLSSRPDSSSPDIGAPERPQGGERRQLTVMFCDLVGSTELASRLDPEDMREVIAAFQRGAANAIARFDGFIAKYMGDGILAYFGYPRAHEDDAERAVRAGLDLVSRLRGFSLAAIHRMRCRIGIATGLVVVGELIGSGAAEERGVVGETPNLAARLQAIAQPDAVMISATTHRLLGNLFDYRDLGALAIKGFAEPVRVFEVLRESSVSSRFEALHPAATPLVGREEEIEFLLRRWRRVSTGEGHTVLISAEPGVGKSRLVAAFQENLAGEPHITLRYFCSPHHKDSALQPVISHIERAARFEHGETVSQKLDKLRSLLERTPSFEEDYTLIAELLSLPGADGPTARLGPQAKKQRSLEALLRQIEALSQRQPILLVFEDAHWIDPTSLELLQITPELVRRAPILLLLTFRPEFEAPWIGSPGVSLLTLGRLGRRETARLIEQLATGRALTRDLVEEIVERTDGVPLFAEELTKAIVEAGLDEAGARKAIASAPHSASAIPATLHASLMARLDRLEDAKEVAQIGAAIGREFSYPLLSAAAMRDSAALEPLLARLVAAGLLFQRGIPPQSVYTFKHALVQDAAYGTLLRGPRRRIHARIAEVLVDLKAKSGTAVQPELIAFHLQEANELEQALRYWAVAGDAAERRAAAREAIAHYRAALALLRDGSGVSDEMRAREPELSMKLGNALMQAEGYKSAVGVEAYRRAGEIARKLGQAENIARAAIGVAPLLFAECRYREVLGILAEVPLDRLRDATRVQLACMKGVANFGVGEFANAWHDTNAAMRLDREANCTHDNPVGGADPVIVTRAYAVMTATILGDLRSSLALAEDGLSIARARGHPFTIAWALQTAGRSRIAIGEYRDAQILCDDAAAICEAHGFHARLGTVLMVRGAAFFGEGETERGLAEMSRGIEVWRQSSGNFHMTQWIADYADRLVRAGRLGDAEATVQTAESVVAETDERISAAELLRLRGRLLAAAGERQQALDCLVRARDCAHSQKARLFELRAARDLAGVYGDLGRRAEAWEILAPICKTFSEALPAPDLTEARELLARLS